MGFLLGGLLLGGFIGICGVVFTIYRFASQPDESGAGQESEARAWDEEKFHQERLDRLFWDPHEKCMRMQEEDRQIERMDWLEECLKNGEDRYRSHRE